MDDVITPVEAAMRQVDYAFRKPLVIKFLSAPCIDFSSLYSSGYRSPFRRSASPRWSFETTTTSPSADR